jgi:predicted metal-dependent phosphoesterase TrpH
MSHEISAENEADHRRQRPRSVHRDRGYSIGIDLHTHSLRSDGSDTPREVIEHAREAGLDVVALTDHDTTSGWSEAQHAADNCSITLMKGIELSTRNNGKSQHLLGYGFDPGHEAIADMLNKAATSREGRVQQLFDTLATLGVRVEHDDVWSDVETHGLPGRKHFAAALVMAGHVPDDAAAFTRYLAEGGPAYIQRWAPTIEDAIQALRAAGGVAVIAHPWARGSVITEERFAELTDAGLNGIEIDHVEHEAPEERARLRGIARRLGLVATGSSDYHGTKKQRNDLGCEVTDPNEAEALFRISSVDDKVQDLQNVRSRSGHD